MSPNRAFAMFYYYLLLLLLLLLLGDATHVQTDSH
jgi:hypothetical protein